MVPSQLTPDWTRWCFETCLMFGCDAATAGRVAALFADAITKEARRGY